jgi:hypothetical protein
MFKRYHKSDLPPDPNCSCQKGSVGEAIAPQVRYFLDQLDAEIQKHMGAQKVEAGIETGTDL